jgi:hypothetical protein
LDRRENGTIGLFYSAECYAIVIVGNVCASGIIDKRSTEVTLGVTNCHALLIDSADALRCHVGKNIRECFLKDGDLFFLKWGTTITLDATSTMTASKATGESAVGDIVRDDSVRDYYH